MPQIPLFLQNSFQFYQPWHRKANILLTLEQNQAFLQISKSFHCLFCSMLINVLKLIMWQGKTRINVIQQTWEAKVGKWQWCMYQTTDGCIIVFTLFSIWPKLSGYGSMNKALGSWIDSIGILQPNAIVFAVRLALTISRSWCKTIQTTIWCT